MRGRISGDELSSCVCMITGGKGFIGSSREVCGIIGIAEASVSTIGIGFVTVAGGSIIGLGVLLRATFK